MRRLLTGRVLQLLCVAAALLGRVAPFSLLDVGSRRLASKEEKLHSLEPWTYRQHADIVIDSIARWSDLDMGACKARSGNVVLVELLDLCFLPDANALARLTTDFIIFGPFHDQHHANFGPFSELDALYGKDLLEAHLTLKLGRCANGGRSVGDILTLLDHARLQHWVVHQHSAVRHSKIRALPLGFGYSDVRMDKQWTRCGGAARAAPVRSTNTARAQFVRLQEQSSRVFARERARAAQQAVARHNADPHKSVWQRRARSALRGAAQFVGNTVAATLGSQPALSLNRRVLARGASTQISALAVGLGPRLLSTLRGSGTWHYSNHSKRLHYRYGG